MSGKALFTYDPTLFKDDDDAVDEELYEEDVEETKENTADKNEEEVKIDTDLFAAADGQDEEVDFDWFNKTYLPIHSKHPLLEN